MANPKLVRSTTMALGLAIVGLVSASIAVPAFADDEFPTSEQDTLFGGRELNPIDLIHNANLDNGQTPQEFREQTRENLDNASQDFRRQQLERLRELQQQNEEAATEAPK